MRHCSMVLAGLVLSPLTTVSPAQAAPATAAVQAEVRLPHISIVSIGKGPSVVLIPGLASPRSVWDGITPELARNHRVLLVQINGFGGDPAGDNANGNLLPGAVADLAAYLAKEKIERPAVVGHSLGGLIGMMLTKDHPNVVGKLMIVDALPFFGALMSPSATVDSIRPMADQMRSMVANGPTPSQAPPNMSLTAAGNEKVLEWLRRADRKIVGQALYEDLSIDFRNDVPALAGRPLTVVYGVPTAARAAMTKSLYADAYAKVPGAKFVPINDSAHFVMLDQPATFSAALKSFLAD